MPFRALRPSGPLWDNPDFLKLWAAQSLSAVGTRFTREGMPMIAALVLGASALDLGILVALSALPGVVLSPLAGAWIDRVRRRPLLIGADLARAAALATLPVAFWWDALTIGQVIGVATFVAFFSMLFQTADNAYLPSLVGREHLLEANTKLATTDAAAEVAGPALAGVLIQALTAPVAIAVDALSYLWSAACLARIRRPETPVPTGERAPDIWREIREGLSFVAREPTLRPLVLCLGTFTFFLSFFSPLYVLYAVRDLAIPPALLGIVVAMGGVGALAGAPFAERFGRRYPPRRLLFVTLLGYGLGTCLIPLAGGPVWLAAGMLIVPQLFGDSLYMVFSTNALSLRQTVTPDGLQGRVGGTVHWVTGGLGLLAALGAGIVADQVGIRPVLWAGALGIMASCLWLLALPREPQGV
jgi:predicted MFS family arabinose efflux permease